MSPPAPLASEANVNSLWARLLVEELTRLGVTYFCVAPGSRSSPLAAAVGANPLARAVACLDERSVAFHALGYARAAGRPAAVICSSGETRRHAREERWDTSWRETHTSRMNRDNALEHFKTIESCSDGEQGYARFCKLTSGRRLQVFDATRRRVFRELLPSLADQRRPANQHGLQ